MTTLIDSEAVGSASYDVGSPEIINYRELLVSVSRIQGKRNVFIPIRFLSIGLSKLWVRLVTQVPKGLIYPLVDSLRHNMTVDNGRRLPKALETEYTAIKVAIKNSLYTDLAPSLKLSKPASEPKKELSLVQSVQRLPCPMNWSMETVAKHYMAWVPNFLWPFFKIIPEGDDLQFFVRMIKKPLLVLSLSHKRTFDGRELFYITGGLLNAPHPKARIEFRQGVNRRSLMVAIHSFRPSLPWFIYKFTQAPFHRFVMWRFGAELSRLDQTKGH